MQRHMDPDRVELMAKAFDVFGSLLKAVNAVLEVQSMILKTTALIGNVGGTAVAAYLEKIQPFIQEAAKGCDELGQQAARSAAQWREAAESG